VKTNFFKYFKSILLGEITIKNRWKENLHRRSWFVLFFAIEWKFGDYYYKTKNVFHLGICIFNFDIRYKATFKFILEGGYGIESLLK